MEKRVLIVDDSALVTKVLKGLLDGLGYMVETLNSPFGIFKVMRDFKPSLVLLDLHIPSLKGDGIIKLLGQKDFDFEYRVLLFSSEPDDVLKAAAEGADAFGYLSKTLPPQDFIRAVEGFYERCVAEINAASAHPAPIHAADAA